MNPDEIGAVFNKGHLTNDEAIILLVRCAEHYEVNEIVRQLPDRLRMDFKAFIMRSSDEDIPTIGMGDAPLKKDWIRAFKMYYLKSGG
jgi:hypothetical protein